MEQRADLQKARPWREQPMSWIVPKLHREEPLGADLADYLRQIDEIDADAGNLLTGLTEDQFHWSPTSARWSIAQCLVHLVIVGRRYLPILDETIDTARADHLMGRGPFRYGFVERWVVRATEPPPRIRLKTPASARPPDNQPLAGVVANFLAVHDEMRKRIQAAKGLDLARAKVASPYTKSFRMGLGPCFAFLAAHERRHLWQAWQVRNHDLFPPE
jgi:hypothetical protein